MDTENHILFENYLSGTLSKEETLSFELKLEKDNVFNQEFNTYKELSNFLKNKFGNEEASTSFKANLKSISNKHFDKLETPKKVIRFKPWQYAVAASVAILIGVQLFNSLTVPEYGNFVNYDEISLVVRGSENELLAKAEKAFNDKNFTKAEIYFTQLLENDSNNNELILYKSFAQIELNKFNKADSTLNNIRNGNSAFKNKAAWYLALSKLKQKDFQASISILNILPEEADDYKRAQKLLKKLD